MPKVKFLRGTDMSNAVPQDGTFYLDTQKHNLYYSDGEEIQPIIPTIISKEGFKTAETDSNGHPYIRLDQGQLNFNNGPSQSWFGLGGVDVLNKISENEANVTSVNPALIRIANSTNLGEDPFFVTHTPDASTFYKDGEVIGTYSGHYITMQTDGVVDAVYNSNFIKLFDNSDDVTHWHTPVYIRANISPSDQYTQWKNDGGTSIGNLQVLTDTVQCTSNIIYQMHLKDNQDENFAQIRYDGWRDLGANITYKLGGAKTLVSLNDNIIQANSATSVTVIRFLVEGLFAWGTAESANEYDVSYAIIEVPFYPKNAISPTSLGYADKPYSAEINIPVRLMHYNFTVTFALYSSNNSWMYKGISKDQSQDTNFETLSVRVYKLDK